MKIKWKFIYLLVIFFAFHVKIQGQSLFSKSYISGSSAKCIATDSSYYYLGGGLTEGIVLKTDLQGNVKFSKSYNTNSSQFSINDIAVYDGFIYIVGYTRETLSPINNYKNYFIAKIDTSDGHVISSIVGGGGFDDEFSKIIVTDNNEIIILGYVENNPVSFGSQCGLYVKLDSNLNIVNSQKLKLPFGNIQLIDLLKISNVTYLIGSINNVGLDYENMLICKLDNNLNLLTHKTIDLGYSETPWSIKYYKNNIFIAGQINDWINGTFFGDIYLTKIDTNFNVLNSDRIELNIPIGQPNLFIVDSMLYINSLGNIFNVDISGIITSCINTNLSLSDQISINNSISFSKEGDFGLLASNTSFTSCINTLPSFSESQLNLTDTILPIVFISQSISNLDSVVFLNQIFYDSLLCVLSSIEQDIIGKNKIEIFPNPAHSNINININGEIPDLKDIEFYDIQLNKISEFEIINNNSIDICRFTPGMYILKLNIANQIYTNKITILK